MWVHGKHIGTRVGSSDATKKYVLESRTSTVALMLILSAIDPSWAIGHSTVEI
jgi:hypothetical protein